MSICCWLKDEQNCSKNLRLRGLDLVVRFDVDLHAWQSRNAKSVDLEHAIAWASLLKLLS